MIEGIYLLLEILTIMVCLFWLYGKKIKGDGYGVLLIVCHMAWMLFISYQGLGYIFTTAIYLLIALFCVLEFNHSIKKVIINMCIMLLVVGGIQLLCSIILQNTYELFVNKDYYFLLTNALSFLIMLGLYFKVPIYHIVKYVKSTNIVLQILVVVYVCGIMGCLLYAKHNGQIEGMDYLVFFVLSVCIFLLAAAWEKNKAKAREKELELHAYGVYAEAYNELLDTIRMRQHEFDNHLQTIISLQHSYSSYEELVNAQKRYIGDIQKSNKYNKLCRKGNPIFIGFLYGKLSSFEKKEVLIRCRLDINNLDMDMPMYKFIEIVSNLLNNACEALNWPVDVKEPICLEVVETTEEIQVEVLNRSEPINLDYLCSCFNKGKSSKGEGRGLGLYNIKMICDEYKAKIFLENKTIDEKNWISFGIKIPKAYQKMIGSGI